MILQTKKPSLGALLHTHQATASGTVEVWGKPMKVSSDAEQRQAATFAVKTELDEKVLSVKGVRLAPKYRTEGFKQGEYALATRGFTAQVTVEREGKPVTSKVSGWVRTGELPDGTLMLDSFLGHQPRDASERPTRKPVDTFGTKVQSIGTLIHTPVGSLAVWKGVNPMVDATMNVLEWSTTALRQGLVPTPAVAAQVFLDGLAGKDAVTYVVPK